MQDSSWSTHIKDPPMHACVHQMMHSSYHIPDLLALQH
jgi:hypothetical protein